MAQQLEDRLKNIHEGKVRMLFGLLDDDTCSIVQSSSLAVSMGEAKSSSLVLSIGETGVAEDSSSLWSRSGVLPGS